MGGHFLNRFEQLLSKSVFVFPVAFGALAAWNADRLFDPPYWDAIMGYCSQGIWLKENGFNYLKLFGQPGFWDGGVSRTHLWNVLALVYGALNVVFSRQVVFFSFHIFNLICAGATISVFHYILRQRMSPWLATVWVMSLAASPIWTGQCAAMYLEIPAAALSSFSYLFLWRKKYFWAACFCVVGFFFKSSALLQGFTYFVFGLLFWINQGLKPASTQKGSVKNSLYLFLPYLIMTGFHQVASSSLKFPWKADVSEKLSQFLTYMPFLYEGILIQSALAMLLMGYHVFKWRSNSRVFQTQEDFQFLLCLTLLVGGFWLSYMLFLPQMVRYTIVIHFPIACLLGMQLARHKWVSAGVALLIFAYGGLNQNGSLLSPIPSTMARSGELLERSREYLKDLDGNRAICQILEKKYFNQPIVTTYPFTQMLTMPELGYVKRPLPNVFAVGLIPLYAKALNSHKGISKPSKTLVVYRPSTIEVGWKPSLKPQKGDKLLFAEQSLPTPTLIYLRDWPAIKSQKRREKPS